MAFLNIFSSKTSISKENKQLAPPPPTVARILTNFKQYKKTALSLAEVLVTLTVIGIIAALTIPNIIYNLEKRKIEAGVLTAYEILDNAIKASEIDNGPISTWDHNPYNAEKKKYWCTLWGDNGGPKIFAEKYLIPYLKVAYICNNTPKKPCFAAPEYDSFACNSGEKVNNYLDPEFGYNFCLQNGMCMSVSCKQYSNMFVSVDINGPHRGGSILGRDVFRFGIGLNSTKLKRRIRVNPGQSNVYDSNMQDLKNPNGYKWGYSNLQCYSWWTGVTGAQHGGCAGGHNCAGVIAKNGWKIPDDYPLKKMAKKMIIK